MLARAERPDFRLVKLEENFRSCAEVCAAANNLIRNNVNRVPKETRSVSGAGGQVAIKEPFATEGGEIGWVAQEIKALLETGGPNGAPSVAVLSRTNAIAAAFRATLAACKIPVVSREVSGLPRDWNYARSFVELLNAPENDALAFFYLIADFEQNGQTPKRARELAHAARRDAASKGQSINSSLLKFGKFTSPELALQALASQRVSKEAQALAVERYRDLPPGATMLDFALSLAEVRERVSEGKEDGAVHVLTGHGAKGMEFDAVFVVGCEDELYPGSREDPEESRRLLYVCLTRARRLLYLTGCQTRMSPWRKSEALKRNPSRFLKEIQP
jgi:DNA helicase-2/ATP-dependent DNA helicase PcrA